MRADSFKEDLNFLYAALLNHPSMYRDPQIKRNFIQLYQSKEDKVCSYDSLVNAATELTVFLWTAIRILKYRTRHRIFVFLYA